MISIIITSYKEPRIVGRAIESALRNKTKEKFEVIVAAPDEETAQVIKNYVKKDKRVKYFKDKGQGKANALNEIFSKVKSDILVLTDGDVYINEKSIDIIVKAFKNKEIGCICGRPVATNDKNKMVGYWSHLLLDAGAHAIRQERSYKKQFLECSGYLFAFRNKVKKIPTDVAEDAIIPYLLWKQGYIIKYVPEAKVYVRYPDKVREFIKQRIRTGKSHEKLTTYAPDFQKVKSLSNEVRKGTWKALKYATSIKEMIWTLLLFPVRLYIWHKTKSGNEYRDNWERIESTK